MTPELHKTAILIVTFNGWEMTQICLQRLAPLAQDGWKIIVADNASTDGTPLRIQKEFPFVQCIILDHNCGFGVANNRAAQHAKDCDIICLLNNDTIPDPEMLRNLESVFRQSATYSPTNTVPLYPSIVLTPLAVNRDGSHQLSHYRDIPLYTYLLFPFLTQSFINRITQGRLQKLDPSMSIDLAINKGIEATDWSSAVCWMMPKKAWDSIGGFDEHIFMYFEDLDLAWRARENGIRFLVATTQKLIHLGGGSSISSYSKTAQYDWSQEYVFSKKAGFKGVLIARLFQISRSGIRLITAAIRVLYSGKSRGLMSIHAKLLIDSLTRPLK